jgi:hypothetical protein
MRPGATEAERFATEFLVVVLAFNAAVAALAH